MPVVKILADFRKEQGLSTAEMAERLGLSKSFYEKVEYSQRKPSRSFLSRFKQEFPTYDMNIFLMKNYAKCVVNNPLMPRYKPTVIYPDKTKGLDHSISGQTPCP